jgi:hypothetical protein
LYSRLLGAAHRSARHTSDSEFDHRGPASAFVLWGLGNRGDMRMLLEVLAEGFAENAHAAAMDDADAGKSCEEGTVDELLDFACGFVDGAADHVNF